MFQYVQPAQVLAALLWLKSNNPLYKDKKSMTSGQATLDRTMLIYGRQYQQSSVHHHRLLVLVLVKMLTEQLRLNGKWRAN